MPDTRTHLHWMFEQSRQTLNDGKAESKARGRAPGSVFELMELLKNVLQLPLWNTKSGIPDLNPQPAPAAATSNQYSSSSCILYGVRQQITDHVLQKARIAANDQVTRNNA